jgi:hypothetical protein
MTAIIRARSDETVPIRGVLLQLIAIGLVAAATVILFSIASFSIFETRTEPLTRFSTDHQRSRYSGADAVPAPSGTIQPFLNAATPTGSASPSEGARGTAAAKSEVSSSGRPPSKPTPMSDEASSPPDRPDRPAPELPATDGPQQNEPAERDQAALLSDGNTPEQSAHDRHASSYALDPHAAFRYRVKKECGPIINDPALYRHCVSTFGVRYR